MSNRNAKHSAAMMAKNPSLPSKLNYPGHTSQLQIVTIPSQRKSFHLSNECKKADEIGKKNTHEPLELKESHAHFIALTPYSMKKPNAAKTATITLSPPLTLNPAFC